MDIDKQGPIGHDALLAEWQQLQAEWLASAQFGAGNSQLFDQLMEVENLLVATPGKSPEDLSAQLQYLKEDLSNQLAEVDAKWIELIHSIQTSLTML